MKPSFVKNRLLVTRTDHLGDVLLSLPALAFLRAALPDWEIHFLAREEYRDLLRPFLTERHVRWVPHASIGTGRLAEDWRRERYRAIVLFHADPRLLRTAWLARVPVRVANRSRPSSWVFANAGAWQRRSRGERSEGEYCLELARLAASRLGSRRLPAPPEKLLLPASAKAVEAAKAALLEMGLRPGQRFAVVHPGMRGSALNLSPARYAAIAGWLRSRGLSVVLSVGPAEADECVAGAIQALLPGLPVLKGLSLSQLLEVFRLAEAVVAPSTGPLHLAHWAGTRTIGFFSPVRAHRARRWAPWGGAGRSLALSPPVACPETRSCRGPRCPHFHCMDRAAWQEEAARHMLS